MRHIVALKIRAITTAAASALLLAATAPLVAQPSDLRIVSYTPSSGDTPSSIISVTFDRRVSGAPQRVIDASSIMSIAPTVPGVFEWRDAYTVRFVPEAPYQPGTAVAVSLDTAALASGGTRSGARYELPVRFSGARPLAMMIDNHLANTDWAAGPFPVFRVLYSTVVDLDSVAQQTRIVFPASCGGTIKLKPLRQRVVLKGEGNPIERAGGARRDTIADRYRRVVEFQPGDSLLPNCLGMWHVASFDPTRPSDAWHYGVRTAPPFLVTSLMPCLVSSFAFSRECPSDGLSIVFSAEVSTEDFMKYVHVEPAVSARSANVPLSTIFQLPAKLKAGVKYSVKIDSALRDVYGRTLTGPLQHTITAR